MPESETKTLILRFRDLSTVLGGTIASHREIIRRERFTWWGWWSKMGETVPEAVFRQLDQQARVGGGLDLLLMDTGRLQLFRAHCTAIEWKTSLEPFPAPEDGRFTPAYYQGRGCLAWFRLSEIQEEALPEDTIRKYSYIREDSFFGGAESRYLPFYGKRIASFNEMVPQNRTIWFVRDVRPQDPIHEVSLFDAKRLVPHDFSPVFRQTVSRNLLWVSDLHFSVDGHHGFPETSTASRKSMGRSLQQSLQEDIGIKSLAGAIVSGDLTWRSDPAEYRQAQEFLDELRSWTQLESYDVMVCPGNHDLAFSADPADKESPVEMAPETAREAYTRFYREIFFLEPNQFLSSGRKFLLGGAIPVEIACLNSSLLEQHKGLFQGHGYLGDEQLKDAADQMGWSAEPDGPVAFRIAVVHHHLLPVTYREEARRGQIYSVVLDAEALARWVVKHHVRLVLHGHMHQPFCAKVSRPVDPNHPDGGDGWHGFHVVALGSTGVERTHVGTIGKNTFGLLKFERDHLAVEVHTIDPADRSQPAWKLDIPYREEGD